LAILPVAV